MFAQSSKLTLCALDWSTPSSHRDLPRLAPRPSPHCSVRGRRARGMAPKKDPGAAKAAKDAAAKKAKNIEDKTFGLKNKNKSQKVQRCVIS